MKYLVFLLVLSAVDLSYGWIPPISPSMQNCLSSIFRPQHIRCRRLAIFQDALHGGDISDLEADADNSSPIEPELARLKSEFLTMAAQTKRGFQATAQERNRIRDIIYELARFNPSREPARGYYERSATDDDNDNTIGSTITGKWTLIYTDAPDITGLDTSRNPFATAKLGRIGQECSPPYIKNVIEWLRPDWAGNLPFSGTAESRVLQKVVTSASASPSKPLLVDLKVAGLELEAGTGTPLTSSSLLSTGIQELVQRVQDQGLPAGILSMQPVDLKGTWNPPFGQFEILYVDQDVRIIRTGQNYLAANQRIQAIEDEWF